jgi:hypothetical protein
MRRQMFEKRCAPGRLLQHLAECDALHYMSPVGGMGGNAALHGITGLSRYG